MGRGAEGDDVESARLFRLACDGDSNSGCSNLGWSYATGRGVDTDYAAAGRYWSLGLSWQVSSWIDRPDVFFSDHSAMLEDMVSRP